MEIDRKKFVKRRPELLALEGWYDVDGAYKFKFSCRFHDILRCSEFLDKPRHFASCFSGCYREQPYLRCLNPNWAIVYTPDKHGNFLGRCFVHMEEMLNREPWLVIDKIYGNKLKESDIMKNLKNLICHISRCDTYLSSDTL